jgi:serine/threonine-protein kinase
VELLSEAHALAPSDPMILAALARARSRQWFQEGGVETGRGARELAERALAAAPERGEPWLAVASVRFIELDSASAARHLLQAVARATQLADAHELLADMLLEAGDLEAAVARHRLASSLDPRLRNRFGLVRALGLLGRWTEVDAVLAVPPEDEEARVSTVALGSRLALWRPDTKERLLALPTLEHAPEITAVRYARLVADVVKRGGFSPEQRVFVHEQFVRDDEAPRFVAFKHQLAAELSAWVGETDAALEHLRALARLGLPDQNWLERCPALEPLRKQPELEAVKSRVSESAEAVRRALSEP